MTDQQHPITPPPELVREWCNAAPPLGLARAHWIATQAARWGADAELEACCEWLREAKHHGLGDDVGAMLADRLRAAMHPKPPSLAEQALEQLNGIGTLVKAAYGGDLIDETIRAALERLQELEQGNG